MSNKIYLSEEDLEIIRHIFEEIDILEEFDVLCLIEERLKIIFIEYEN